jgi:hypothetical protein
MRLYFCRSEVAESRYISLSVFHDVFGGTYTKPLYIEKNERTTGLAGRCYERRFRGRDFYSLIKDPRGIYRHNATIYRDAHDILRLPFEEDPNMAFLLMKAKGAEIEESCSPRQAFEKAVPRNALLAATVDFVLRDSRIPQHCLGLIGSLAIDPASVPRDVDLVFSGDCATLDRAYKWIRDGSRPGVPLQRHLPNSLPIVCAFFDAEPPVYPDLSGLLVLEPVTRDFDMILKEPVSPPYLNVQVYRGRQLPAEQNILLVVRDTLSRAGLDLDVPLRLSGFPSSVGGEAAILVTDVEEQMPTVPFHGGGAQCSYPDGATEQ